MSNRILTKMAAHEGDHVAMVSKHQLQIGESTNDSTNNQMHNLMEYDSDFSR